MLRHTCEQSGQIWDAGFNEDHEIVKVWLNEKDITKRLKHRDRLERVANFFGKHYESEHVRAEYESRNPEIIDYENQ